MKFVGTWVNESQTLIYRVVPKGACTTIGQIIYYGDHGKFHDGDIHDLSEGIWKWNGSVDPEHARDQIVKTVRKGEAFCFTCVRNPYTRILSAFFDKICSIQPSGNRYRGEMVPNIVREYGMDLEGDFDQIRAFRKFLLFARDTIKYRKPMIPDIHWCPISRHLRSIVHNGGSYGYIFAVEDFNTGMQHVLDQVTLRFTPDLETMPRFNESESYGPKRAHPVEDYFDDLSIQMMNDVYNEDFAFFKYDRAPGRGGPTGALDPAEINAQIAALPR